MLHHRTCHKNSFQQLQHHTPLQPQSKYKNLRAPKLPKTFQNFLNSSRNSANHSCRNHIKLDTKQISKGIDTASYKKLITPVSIQVPSRQPQKKSCNADHTQTIEGTDPSDGQASKENTGFSMSYRIPCKNPRRKTITEERRTPKTSTSAPGRRWVNLKKPNDDRERERGREGYRSGWPSHSLQRLCARRESGVEFLRLFLRLSVAVCLSAVTATATDFCCGFYVAKDE